MAQGPGGAGSGGGALRARLGEARRSAGLGPGPWAVGLADDTPLLGTLGNVYVAVATAAAARADGRRGLLCLLPAGSAARPLYMLGRDGEMRRLAVRPAAAIQARRACLALLGSAEAVCGRSWPLAREALDQASRVAASPDADRLFALWSLHLWRAVLAPAGVCVAHAGLPPLADALGRVGAACRPLEPLLREDVAGAAGMSARASPAARPLLPGAGAAPRLGLLLALRVLLPEALVVADDRDAEFLRAGDAAAERLGAGGLVVRPRPAWTVVAPAEAAFARTGGAPLDEGPGALRRARDRALLDAGAPRLAARLGGLRAAIGDHLRAVAAVAGDVPGGEGVVADRGRRMLGGLDRLEAELGRRASARQRALARAWRHTLNLLHPFGEEQEDWLAAFPWAAAGVHAFLEFLLDQPAGAGRRWVRWPPDGRAARAAARAVSPGVLPATAARPRG